jgi:hypothetical protein
MTAVVMIASVAIQAYILAAQCVAATTGRPRPIAGDHEAGTFD